MHDAGGAATKADAAQEANKTKRRGPESPRWRREDAAALFSTPFADLIFRAQQIHRRHFKPNEIEKAQLLSIKTGGCPEDCSYCSQSARFETGLKATKLMSVEAVRDAAREAKAGGATRFCMGAAWRSPKDRDMDAICGMIREVKALGLEACMTLGMLTETQAARLRDAGLDFYNHNLDTSERYYSDIVSTRSYRDRLDTLDKVREAGISVCAGGIIGMGEAREDRIDLLAALANLPEPPGSVPINGLMPQAGTPLEGAEPISAIEFARTIAAARIMMPTSVIRLSAGREAMSDEAQALCFLAGANSIFVGERLLTAGNPDTDDDDRLFDLLGLQPTVTAARCSTG